VKLARKPALTAWIVRRNENLLLSSFDFWWGIAEDVPDRLELLSGFSGASDRARLALDNRRVCRIYKKRTVVSDSWFSPFDIFVTDNARRSDRQVMATNDQAFAAEGPGVNDSGSPRPSGI
jgi:hypothetical protein